MQSYAISRKRTCFDTVLGSLAYSFLLFFFVFMLMPCGVLAKPNEENPTYIWQLSDQGPDSYPRLAGEMDFVIEYNSLFDADVKENEHDDWLLKIPLILIYRATQYFNVDTELLVVFDGEDNDFRDFDGDYKNEGLYLEKLLLQYDSDSVNVFVGRYEPAGKIFGHAPIYFGNYSTELNLYGQVGGGITLSFANDSFGKHALTGHLFYLDTSRVSGEVINNRGGNQSVIGGAGNTGEFNNYLVTINGGPVKPGTGIRYSAGSGLQSGNPEFNELDEEIGFISLLGVYSFENKAEVRFSVDFLVLENVDGQIEDRKTLTFGLSYSNWPTMIGLSYSERLIEPDLGGEPNRVDEMIELVWRFGVTEHSYVEGAYQRVDEDNTQENSIGLSWIYSFDWLWY